jgi:hypothetical protein
MRPKPYSPPIPGADLDRMRRRNKRHRDAKKEAARRACRDWPKGTENQR